MSVFFPFETFKKKLDGDYLTENQQEDQQDISLPLV